MTNMGDIRSVTRINCNTVGDLLDELTRIAKDETVWDMLNASIAGPNGETFDSFRIIRRKLSDGSEVLDFELAL